MTPKTKGPKTSAVLLSSTVAPSSQVAVTTIVVFPMPKTIAFTVICPPATIMPTVSVFSLGKTSPPLNLMLQETFVAEATPVFLIVVVTPNPPFMVPI